MSPAGIPDALASIRDDFLALGQTDRLQLLLEFSDELPDPPAGVVPANPHGPFAAAIARLDQEQSDDWQNAAIALTS